LIFCLVSIAFIPEMLGVPPFTHKRFCSAIFTEAVNRRTPAGSVAIGFVAQQCFPALITASKCSGRYPGGVARSTRSTSDAITFL
jgi:hypothetical protein